MEQVHRTFVVSKVKTHSAEVHFICGTGGVGKTTCSVAMAFKYVRNGKRCALLTIDPAQRLADALHISIATDKPSPVPLPFFGNDIGTLDAMMLDAPTAFSSFSKQYSSTKEWYTLKDNRYFQFAAQRMGGIQEMMAILQMMELVESNDYDCIIIDTPPAQNVEAFFDAPDKVQHLFSASALGWLTSKSKGFASSNLAKSILTKGLQFFLGQVTMTEISEFFTQFKSVAQALESIAKKCTTLLHSPSAHYWLIEVPHYRVHQLSILETSLQHRGFSIDGRILNRVSPPLPIIPTEQLEYIQQEQPSSAKIIDLIQQLDAIHSTHTTEHTPHQLPLVHSTEITTIQGLWIWSLALDEEQDDNGVLS